jgi:glycine dehydrogenase
MIKRLSSELVTLVTILKPQPFAVSSVIRPTSTFTVDDFSQRHIGSNGDDVKLMLHTLGFKTLDQLSNAIVPESIQLRKRLQIESGQDEKSVLEELHEIAKRNAVWKSYIGLGYHDCIVPKAILRNVFENPGWITQYTPYQPEISQGRLECLLNFQTMITDLTALNVANASLLDEATACAEAMALCYRFTRRKVFLVDVNLHPQNIALIRMRAGPLGIEVRVLPHAEMEFGSSGSDAVCGCIVQYPDTNGLVENYESLFDRAHKAGALGVCVADLLACAVLKPPGEMGADVAVGSVQRLGVPLNYGGPHAAYLSVGGPSFGESLLRLMPGRMVGLTKDADGNPAYRLALQTREQHIRRDKATSNICTAQALLANMSALYAVYHGPRGLRRIAENVHKAAAILAEGAFATSAEMLNAAYFDTVKMRVRDINVIKSRAAERKINLRYYNDNLVSASLDETVGAKELEDLGYVFGCQDHVQKLLSNGTVSLIHNDNRYQRETAYLTHPVFNTYQSETNLVRYMKLLENKDVSLVHSMIPLGSCTMKLNSSVELVASSWPEFTNVHPFAPIEQTAGYRELFGQLETWLCELTGYDNVSLQPNSGAQGEYAGLRAIKAYHESRGDHQRNICLIPTSAHGTNAASAHMAGMRCIAVGADRHGNVQLKDLKAKVEKYKDTLGAIMITYPSTHGVFEPHIREVCDLVHEFGGQVYLDGANLNAQVGLCKPGEYGSDVSHLNLHKTFCIPHGGGGPGVGPIGVKSHLAPFLPGHPVIRPVLSEDAIEASASPGPVNGAPWGSAAILPISWSYIRLMGGSGLHRASQIALLNANYMMKRLEPFYKIMYRGTTGFCAHEFIIDAKPFKKTSGIEVIDIAKRLMDYGFHAPTMSFPVPGSLMIEPTECEDKAELDRFCDALIAIRREIQDIETGKLDRTVNPLKMAPHTLKSLLTSKWDRPYNREQAAYPIQWTATKIWPTVSRIDDQYGDRNLICSCPPLELFTGEEEQSTGLQSAESTVTASMISQ